ncbi:DUF397 domain-containing protein [Streptomyces sp. ISL-12]|uniref:DUF397 domain-containing protein n=1 Tax=Streptomyces sp. ISL-12 TaxID=2819177 RepID=UPI001BEA4370|nr:DUF397 domain-containing protein [Streptomyces sp. ISL-12]MBT2415377.1 DUF397 domain-containing protein [Streptomyces sp. ISL-12]
MSSALKWFKSSYSSNDGPECVEVAISATAPGSTVHVRDSKDTSRPHLSFTDATWTSFTGTITSPDRPA